MSRATWRFSSLPSWKSFSFSSLSSFFSLSSSLSFFSSFFITFLFVQNLQLDGHLNCAEFEPLVSFPYDSIFSGDPLPNHAHIETLLSSLLSLWCLFFFLLFLRFCGFFFAEIWFKLDLILSSPSYSILVHFVFHLFFLFVFHSLHLSHFPLTSHFRICSSLSFIIFVSSERREARRNRRKERGEKWDEIGERGRERRGSREDRVERKEETGQRSDGR